MQQPNYDFIMNPNSSAPKTGGSPNGLLGKVLVGVGILAVLVVLLIIGAKLFSGGGDLNKPAMLAVAQDQAAITHLLVTGTEDSTTAANKNFSATATLSFKNDQAAFTQYLSSNGYKPAAVLLNGKISATTDSSLTTAQASSNFDTVYASAMTQSMQTYLNDLSAAYTGAGAKGKVILKTCYDNAQLLLTQLTGIVPQTTNQ